MSERIKKSIEQKGAEADVEAFAKDRGPFVVAAETTRMPMVFTDAKAPGHPIIFANDAFLSLSGYDREEVLGQSFNFLMGRGTDPEGLAKIKAAFETSADVDPEIRCRRKDGSQFWASVMISPVRDKRGNIVQHFASLIDLTKHKDAQAQSEILIGELNHRVKNTLATVQGFVSQTLRTASDSKTARTSIDARLFALARSHDLLTEEKWESAGLLDVVDAAMKPFVEDVQEDRFTAVGENFRIRPSAVLGLSIAFHELATNAVKYGAFSNEVGRITVRWEIVTMEQGAYLCLRWQESGGPPVSPPSRTGFGMRLIREGLSHQFLATVKIEYDLEGLVCTISIPVSMIVCGE